jgi:hypothetical protein
LTESGTRLEIHYHAEQGLHPGTHFDMPRRALFLAPWRESEGAPGPAHMESSVLVTAPVRDY